MSPTRLLRPCMVEAFFDADYPGHYLRRLKNVSVTIPAVIGPYGSVNCTLRLLSNQTRVSAIVGESYREQLDTDDERFVTNFASIQSIATSTAQNDSGLFELSFRDERYLAFEGAGAVSRWRSLPRDNNAFDFETISDVVLHLRYGHALIGRLAGRLAEHLAALARGVGGDIVKVDCAEPELPSPGVPGTESS